MTGTGRPGHHREGRTIFNYASINCVGLPLWLRARRRLGLAAAVSLRPATTIGGLISLYVYFCYDSWGTLLWWFASVASILLGTIIANLGITKFSKRPSVTPLLLYSGIFVMSLRPALSVYWEISEGPDRWWTELHSLLQYTWYDWIAFLSTVLVAALFPLSIAARRGFICIGQFKRE
jgi:hypothetical protein